MKILLAAEESAGLQLLRQLSTSGHEIVGVLATPDETSSPAPSVWKLAQKLGLTVRPAARVRDAAFAQELSDLSIDLLLNVHSLHVMRREILALPRFGAFNLHPGPLPRYAGLNAPSWAILRGERTYGVTLHRMEPGVDTGAVAFQATWDIDPAETALTLYLKCVRYGLPLVMRLIETIAADPESLKLSPQDPTARQYFGREVPNDGWLDMARPAAEVGAFVRAFDYAPFRSPWGSPRLLRRGEEIGILKAQETGCPARSPPGTVVGVDGAVALLACNDTCLAVSQVEVTGQRRLPGDVLVAGERLETPDGRKSQKLV